MLSVLYQQAGFPLPRDSERVAVKSIDLRMLVTEVRDLMEAPPAALPLDIPDHIEPYPHAIKPWTWDRGRGRISQAPVALYQGVTMARIPHHVRKAATALMGGAALCRQTSRTEQGRKGGGFVYFLSPGGNPFPPVSGRYLVDNGLVEPHGPGLLPDMPPKLSTDANARQLMEA